MGAAAVGASFAVLAATFVGVLTQPRFTVLELAAQRLVPDGQDAQPPVEQVGRFAAFDRHYTVRFETTAPGLQDVLDTAVGRRWQVVSRSGRRGATLEREGVRAVVVVGGGTTRIDTAIATSVRDRQRWSRLVALGGGAGLASWWVWRQIRGRPRLAPAPPRGDE